MASKNMTTLYGLGDRIRETREKCGISLTELANAVGSNKSALSNIERGERVPSLETVSKLADELNVPIATWFQESPSNDDVAAGKSKEENRMEGVPDVGHEFQSLFEQLQALPAEKRQMMVKMFQAQISSL